MYNYLCINAGFVTDITQRMGDVCYMADTKINIMLADDHTLFREGMKKLLESNPEIQIVIEAADGEECLNQIDNSEIDVDVLLLDISMPHMNGIDVLKKIKESNSQIKVFILTASDDIEYLVKAVDLGVNGYALKSVSYSEFISAIKHVKEGKQYIQTSLIPALNNKLIKRDIDKDKIDSLTKREMEMIIQIASGMSNKEIANSLFITERTVKNHISSLFKKINVSDRTQAAVFAIRNNLIKLS